MNNNHNHHPIRNIPNPTENDILCGRGGGTNAHSGNIKFRRLVAAHKLRYLAASKSDKPNVARDVVKEWRGMNPPGRFLAKMDMKMMILEGLITIEDMKEEEQAAQQQGSGSGGIRKEKVYWHDVGDKKAREKASQCLRERNGAANEAVAALVKTVTANGEACPEDYATLMSKAALLKEEQMMQQQQQQQMGGMQQHQQGGVVGNNAYYGGGNNTMTYGDYSNMGGVGVGGGGYCEPVISASGVGIGGSNAEDDVIEAEIQRLLREKQEQMMMNMNNNVIGGGGGNNINNNNIMGNNNNNSNNNNYGGGGSNGGYGGDIQPYMGEESVMREYRALIQKQQELDARLANANAMMSHQHQGNHNGGGGGGMMSSPYNTMGGMMGGGGSHTSPYGNQQQLHHQQQQQPQAPYMQDSPQQSMSPNPNPNAARDYMNRLRMLRQGNHGIDLPLSYNGGGGGGMPENIQSSSGGVGGNMSNMGGGNGMNAMNMNNMGGGNNMGGRGGGRVNSFSIEEYQASLQEFLHNDDGRELSHQQSMTSQATTPFDNTSNNANSNNPYLDSMKCIQVPTNINDGNRRSYARRNSDRSVDDIDLPIGRNTFKSVDSDDRPSFQSMDDVGIRDTFRSVDTMDLMSIGASLNEIVEEDINKQKNHHHPTTINNPKEQRKKYSRRLSASSRHSRYGGANAAAAAGGATLSDFAHLPGATLEVKTMNHGQGGGGGPKKIRKAIDPRLIDMAGKSGGSGVAGKDTILSADLNLDELDDGRMSFGNMSLMSGLTDFGDIDVKGLGGGDDA